MTRKKNNTRAHPAPAPPPPPHPQPNNSNNPQAGIWFRQSHPFVYDPTAGLLSNFTRLAAQRNWGPKLRRRRWTECQEEEFGHAFGTDTNKLAAWQELCREVGIVEEEVPGSIRGCRTIFCAPQLYRQRDTTLLRPEIFVSRSWCSPYYTVNVKMLNTPRAWSLRQYAKQFPDLMQSVTESNNKTEDQKQAEELRRLAERKAIDRDYIDYIISSDVDKLAKNGENRASREELLAMITPRFEGYYDMSLALDRLYEARMQDNLPGYRDFASISPMLVIRDMTLAADQEAERQTTEHKQTTDELASMLDFCTKVHLTTASATLKFLDGLGFAQDPKIKSLRSMLEKSQRALIDNHKACVEAGILTKENTKSNGA
ncbi:hypothetical protein PtrSN001A_010775 [Pyrenophora tritici-repentis]|nr:hypothetical protein PtrSN001A_010775 [Pyrenophora tritici-repentis]KAI1575372.1 hypothetical protein PtrEW13061_010827 [Pyrenophora tritici-repentis]